MTLLFSTTALPAATETIGAVEFDFFEAKIRPVLSAQCHACHSSEAVANNNLKGGLRLDQRDAAYRGGDRGVVIVPGKPEESLLLQALRHNDKLKMPPSGALSEGIVVDFTDWIRNGAPWPTDTPAATRNESKLRDYEYWRTEHWSWRPLEDRGPPTVKEEAWSTTGIDIFVLARLRAAMLTPSPPAERAILYRRIHYGLLGLPPSYEDTQRFVGDPRPDAYERAVDRMLASPAYGEKWGRHWLDVARYADNGGFNSFNKDSYTNFPYAFTYRDYVIRAFNDDLPYDRFILEQLAADKLDLGEDNRALAALGFMTLGDKSFGVSKEDRVDDCIDTVTRGLMGITVSCARCHDHKYDPIPIEDYYSLFSVFQNSTIDVAARLHTVENSAIFPPLFETQAQRLAYQASVDRASQQLDKARQRFFDEASQHLRQRIADYLLAAAGRADDKRKARLSDEVIKRWQAYLQTVSANEQSVFVAWRAFLKLPEGASHESFRATLADLTAASPPDKPTHLLVLEATLANFTALSPPDKLTHSLVIEELRKRPPQSLEDVAEVYGQLLSRVEQEKQQVEGDGSETLIDVFTAKGSPIRLKQEEALKLPIHGGAKELERLGQELHGSTFDQPRAVSLTDKSELKTGRVFTRGNPDNPGESVPRQFLALLSPTRKAFVNGSGRLELARTIIDPKNPLTARVIVNRLWQHHFGVGLVETASDFGVRGSQPSHPGLLDYLAARLIEGGWSLKRIHRRILLSQVYRQASFDRPDATAIDPDNRLLWRKNRQRLMFESLRDSTLVAAGELDRSIGGRPVPTWESRRRTVYGYVSRYRIAAGYRTFDFPSPTRTSPHRSQTLVPQQSLFLMNAPFVQQRGNAVVEQLGRAEIESDSSWVVAMYRRILCRDPAPSELQAAVKFVSNVETPSTDDDTQKRSVRQRLAHALFLSNEFSYVD